MPPAKKDEGAMRKKVEQTAAKVDELRASYREKPTEANGRKLLKAREDASAALTELWDAVPQEKPPTQFVM